jgi:hypothetical protein
MKKCPFCDKDIEVESSFCRYCGKEIPKIEISLQVEKSNPRSHKLTLIFGIILGILILAVGGYFLLRPKPHAPVSAQPILYAMDFENKAAFFGWHVGGPGTDLFWLENTQDGKYIFEFPSGFLETEDLQFGDIEFSTDVEFLSEKRMDVSVACRLHQGEAYRFIIANDGRWNIVKWFQGAETNLANGWSAEIKMDKNKLAGLCVGNQFTLIVNGIELGKGQDNDMSIGGIGLGYNAETAKAGSFDNLLVTDWSSK